MVAAATRCSTGTKIKTKDIGTLLTKHALIWDELQTTLVEAERLTERRKTKID
jgi:hypothetical protein